MKRIYILAASVCICAGLTNRHCLRCAEPSRLAANDIQPQLIDPAGVREDPESAAEAELGSIIIRAKYYARSGENEKAREAYLEAISKFPGCAYAHFQLASMLLGADEKDSRIEHLEKAIELDPGMNEAYEALGFCYSMKDDAEKAIATYKKAIQNVDDSLPFYSSLADAYLSLEKTKEAEETLLEACDRHPASPQSWFKLIEFYLSGRQTQKADETLEKALKATENSLKLLRDVRGLYRRWDEEKALAILVRTLELYPESPQMWVQLVRQYLSRGEKEKAEQATKKAMGHLRYNESLFNSLAFAYVNIQDWDSAIAVLTEATKYHGDSVDIWRTLASLYEQKGETKNARECYRKVLSMEPARIQDRRLLALSYVAEKDYQGAIREFQEAIRIFPGDIRFKVDLANTYLASGQFEEGEKVYQQLIKVRPANSDVCLLLANYYLKADKPEKMQETIDAAVQLEKDPARQARILALMGQAALEKKELPIALKLLQEAVKRQPDEPSHAYALARAYLLTGEREKAAEHLQKAVELAKPPNPDWLLTLGRTYRALGNKDQAAESFSKAITVLQENCKKGRKNWLNWYRLGQAYETAEDEKLAAKAYASCVELQPENGDLKYKLATVYSELHQHEKAQEQLEDAIKLPSPKPEWFLLQGEVYRTLAKREEAARAFEGAIAILREEQDKRPEDSRMWAVFGDAYSRSRQYADAVEALGKAIELAGENTDFRLHVALAQALENSGHSEPAREQYLKAANLLEKAAENNPDDPDNYLRLGLIYQNLRDYAKSVEALSKGVELAGGDASYSSQVALADSLEKGGKSETAQAQFRKAYSLLSDRIKEHPDDVMAHYMLANVCDRLSSLDECEREYRTVMKLDPFFASAYNNLGYTWIERNLNLEEAMKLVRKALELDPQSGAYIDSLGWGYFKQGKLDEALAELLRALKFDSTDPAIFDHIGDVYKAKNMIKEAIQYWKKALEMNPHDQKIKEKIEKNQNALPPSEEEHRPGNSE